MSQPAAHTRIGAVIPAKGDLPPELTEKKNWVLWGYEVNEKNKEIKVPYAPWRTGGELLRVSAPDSNNWETFDHAVGWAGKFQSVGVGFAFSDVDRIAGVDLDDSVEIGENGEPILSELAKQVLEKAGSYAEISPSGKGVKIFVMERAKRKKPLINHEAGVEVYDKDRFFAITGVRLKEAPKLLADGEELLNSLYRNWEKPKKRVDEGPGGVGLSFPVEKLLGENWVKLARGEGDWLRGAHPIHGSTSGTNFKVNVRSGGWYCFRCAKGGGPLELLAVMERLVGCDKLGERGHRLSGEILHQALKIAKERGLIEKGIHPARSFFDEDNRFIPLWLAQRIMEDLPIITHRESWVIYGYKDGVYWPDGEAAVRELARRYLGEVAKDHYINETVKQIRDTTFRKSEDFETPPELLCVENGILNVLTKELQPHTPKSIFLQKLPAKYDPAAKCPTVVRRLGEWTNLKGIVRTVEFSGFSLYRDYFIRKALIIHGPGGNGKTTLVSFLTKWLGRNNTAGIKVQNLEKRFTAARLFGKLANLCDDLPSDEWFGTGSFKQATGGSPLEGEKKFKDEFTFSSYAKMLFTGNKLPIVSDDSQAFWDRICIIPFERRFDDAPENVKAERRNEIIAGMTTEEERSGFLNLALAGLASLMEDGEFFLPEDMETVKRQYTKISDPVMAFSNEMTVDNPKEKTPKAEIYAAYVDYCNKNGFPIKENNAFGRSFKRCHPRIEDSEIMNEEGRRMTAWRGVVLVGSENEPLEVENISGSPRVSRDSTVFSLLYMLYENYPLQEVIEYVEQIKQDIGKNPRNPRNPRKRHQHLPLPFVYPELIEILRKHTGELVAKAQIAKEANLSIDQVNKYISDPHLSRTLVDRGGFIEVLK